MKILTHCLIGILMLPVFLKGITPLNETPDKWITVPGDIRVKEYFDFTDSLVDYYSPLVEYPLNEHVLVHANYWIIDTLASFDYYKRKARGQFIYDQREMVVLRQGDSLVIPGTVKALHILDKLSHTIIDVNIPEYKLRIIVGGTVLFTFPVRVGRNEVKFLKTAGREVSLRTPIGEGSIVRLERDPYFVNPVTGNVYNATMRDDGEYTRMPQIPWIEPMINGVRPGSLIHPTTNPNTLEKASSNGCVGTAEGDAWIVYYYSPLGTKVRFRYDLEVVNENGELVQLKDIYGLQNTTRKE